MYISSYMDALRKSFVSRRHALGMTQEAVATAAGLTRKTVSDFENAKVSITVLNLQRMLQVVGLELTTREASSRPTLDELTSRYVDDDETTPQPRRRVRTASKGK
jgi:transcriptional regulator with XRE-family HTH domain